MSVEGVTEAIEKLNEAIGRTMGLRLSEAKRLPRKFKKALKVSYDDWRMNEIIKAYTEAMQTIRKPTAQDADPHIMVALFAARTALALTQAKMKVNRILKTSFKTYLYAYHFNNNSVAVNPDTGRSYKRLERGRLTRQATRRIHANLSDIIRTVQFTARPGGIQQVGSAVDGAIHSDVRLPHESNT